MRSKGDFNNEAYKKKPHSGTLLCATVCRKRTQLIHPRKTKAAAMFSQSRRFITNAYILLALNYLPLDGFFYMPLGRV